MKVWMWVCARRIRPFGQIDRSIYRTDVLSIEPDRRAIRISGFSRLKSEYSSETKPFSAPQDGGRGMGRERGKVVVRYRQYPGVPGSTVECCSTLRE